MIRRPHQKVSRRRRHARETEFVYVLSFAEAVQRRRKRRPRPLDPRPAPLHPRPLLGSRLTIAEPIPKRPPAASSTRVRELEDA